MALAIAEAAAAPLITHVDLPTPLLGGKCVVVRSKGLFVLERGPGVLRTIACTHAGSGTLEAIDGLPDERGFFADENMPDPTLIDAEAIAASLAESAIEPDGGILAMNRLVRIRAYCTRRGRPLYSANPVVMGSWMLDGGFLHGLTIRASGGHESARAIASVVWMPVPQKVLDDIARRQKAADGHAGD
jgi:hypothetical protein